MIITGELFIRNAVGWSSLRQPDQHSILEEEYKEDNGMTTVTVDLDITEECIEYMNQHYPKALDRLKGLCEKY